MAITIPPEMQQTGGMREPSLVFKNTSSWLLSSLMTSTKRKTLSPKMHYFVAGLEYNYGIHTVHMIGRLSLTPSIVSIVITQYIHDEYTSTGPYIHIDVLCYCVFSTQ